MANTTTLLKGVSNAGDALLSDQLEANLVSFVQWGCLCTGGFFNVTIPSTDYYGGHDHVLAPRSDPNYEDGQVWEGFRKDWVWETGVNYAYQPIAISGVWVNGSLIRTSDTGVHAFTIDYPNGRVIFDNPLGTGTVPFGSGVSVQCEYSYRMHHFTTADTDWWRQLQMDSMRADDSQFMQFGSGAYDVLAQNRIQLPAVIVEAVPTTRRWGKQLGGLTQITHQDVDIHILTQDRTQMKWLHDAFSSQKDITLLGFDKNQVLASGAMPLDADGGINPSGMMMYPDLCNTYGWRKLFVFDTKSMPVSSRPPIYSCLVRCTFEVDTP